MSQSITLNELIANHVPAAGRFHGGRKVYVSAAYDAAARLGYAGSLADFKALLLSGLGDDYSLARADLVEACDRAQLARSEVHHLGAVFSFIVLH